MRDPTPGAVAYAAFDAAFPANRWVRLGWADQAPAVQAAWEAAAQAVLADGLGHLLAREAAAIRQVGALVQTACTYGAGPELARAIAALKPWVDAQQAAQAAQAAQAVQAVVAMQEEKRTDG